MKFRYRHALKDFEGFCGKLAALNKIHEDLSTAVDLEWSIEKMRGDLRQIKDLIDQARSDAERSKAEILTDLDLTKERAAKEKSAIESELSDLRSRFSTEKEKSTQELGQLQGEIKRAQEELGAVRTEARLLVVQAKRDAADIIRAARAQKES